MRLPLRKNILLQYYELLHKLRVIFDGIRRSSVLWLGLLFRFPEESCCKYFQTSCRHGLLLFAMPVFHGTPTLTEWAVASFFPFLVFRHSVLRHITVLKDNIYYYLYYH